MIIDATTLRRKNILRCIFVLEQIEGITTRLGLFLKRKKLEEGKRKPTKVKVFNAIRTEKMTTRRKFVLGALDPFHYIK